jgi:hypothetical protein
MSMIEQTGQHENPTNSSKNPLLNDAWYNALEYLARVVLPGAATLYLALSQLWGFANGAAVVGTIVAVDTFLGLFLGVAMKSFDKSDVAVDGNVIIVEKPDGSRTLSMRLEKTPEELAAMSTVKFRVEDTTAL